MLTVERSVPLLEGLELAVNDDELSPIGPRSPSPHGHCRVWVRHRSPCGAHRVRDQHVEASLRLQEQRAAPLKKECLVIQNYEKFRTNH